MDFDIEVLERSMTVPVIVDFWAQWCDPCLMLDPILTELAKENAGRWELVKINSDENPVIAARYNILGVPAVRIFHKGEIIAKFNGLMWKNDFGKWIDAQLEAVIEG